MVAGTRKTYYTRRIDVMAEMSMVVRFVSLANSFGHKPND